MGCKTMRDRTSDRVRDILGSHDPAPL